MIEIDGVQAMREFGERLGRLVSGGEVIELVGDVGAGKTELVRGVARGMGIDETGKTENGLENGLNPEKYKNSI